MRTSLASGSTSVSGRMAPPLMLGKDVGQSIQAGRRAGHRGGLHGSLVVAGDKGRHARRSVVAAQLLLGGLRRRLRNRTKEMRRDDALARRERGEIERGRIR